MPRVAIVGRVVTSKGRYSHTRSRVVVCEEKRCLNDIRCMYACILGPRQARTPRVVCEESKWQVVMRTVGTQATHDTTVSSLIVIMARFTPCSNRVHGVATRNERGDAVNTTGEYSTRACHKAVVFRACLLQWCTDRWMCVSPVSTNRQKARGKNSEQALSIC